MRRFLLTAVFCAAAASAHSAAISSMTVATGLLPSATNFMRTGMALDRENTVHFTFYDPGTQELRYAKMANGDGAFTVTVIKAGVAPQTALALDDLVPHVAYYDIAAQTLFHAQWSGTAWVESTIDNLASSNTFVSLAVGSDHVPQAAYFNGTGTAYGELAGIVWSTFTINASTYAGPVEIALDSADNPRLAFFTGSTDTSIRTLAYAFTVSNTLNVVTLFEVGAGTLPVGGLSLVIDSQGINHLAFFNNFENGLGYANVSADGAVVSTKPLDNFPAAGFNNDIAVNDLDNPKVVYMSTGVGLREAVFDGVNWSSSTLESGNLNGIGPSVAINPLRHFLAGYYDGDAGTAKLITNLALDVVLSGTVLDFAGASIPGVSLILAGNLATQLPTIAGVTGAFSAGPFLEGSYTLTPSKTGFTFSPASLTLAGQQTSISGLTFQGGATNFSLLGNVFDPLQGQQVTVNFSVLPGHVLLRLFTLQGRPVRTLVDEDKPAGSYTVFWDGRTADNDLVSSGIYLLRLETSEQQETKKIAVVK